VILGESNYALDDDGNRILIRLTVEETREFLELTDLLASISLGQPLSSIDWKLSPKEVGWLMLMQTHSLEKGVSIKTTMEELAQYMRGWRGYFGFCETPEVLIALTRWVRLRLRAALWRQWKTPGRRRAALIALGVSGELRNTAGSGRGPWHIARSKALSVGLPMPTSNRSVSRPWSMRVSVTSRTAVYGPVRTAVWEGWSRKAPPYPDPWHFSDVANDPDNVHFQGRSGSSRPTAKVTRLTRNG
jgi:hypothetical protein